MAYDYSKLSPEQKENALKVLDAANKYGLNPDFVFPLIMAESQFHHIPSQKVDPVTKLPISFGVMQLTEPTANSYGIPDYRKASESENIDAGMRFLRDLASNSKIDTPEKMVVGYNAGAGNKYLETNDMKDMPEETKRHLENIKKYSPVEGLAQHTLENFVPSQQGSSNIQNDVKEHEKLAGPNNVPFDAEGPGGSSISKEEEEEHKKLAGENNVAWTPGETTVQNVQPNDETASSGAQIGAITAASLSGGTNLAGLTYDLIKNRANVDTGIPSGSTSGGKYGNSTGFGVGEGTVADVVNKRNRLKPNGKMSSRWDKNLPPVQPGESPVTTDRILKAINDQEAAKQAAIDEAGAQTQEQFRASPLGRIATTAYETGRGALSGLATALNAKDAIDAYQNKDYIQSALRGTSALGSGVDLLASVLPDTVPLKTVVRGVTAPLAMAFDAASNIHQHAKDKQYSEIPLDIAQAGLGLIPYAGIPLTFGMAAARAHPQAARNAVTNLGGSYGNQQQQLDNTGNQPAPLYFPSEMGL